MCVNKTLAERLIEAQEFMDLVREMRIAQKWYKSLTEHDDRSTWSMASLEKSEKECKVDRWLQTHEDEKRYIKIEKKDIPPAPAVDGYPIPI